MAKKHGHEAKHAHCEHCLHACDHCEVAYCCDCNKEWGSCRLSHYSYPWYVSPSITTPDWTPTWTSGTSDITNTDYTYPGFNVSDCTHVHTN
jgi:hypothetical protein